MSRWKTLRDELETYDAGNRDVPARFKERMGRLVRFMTDDWRVVGDSIAKKKSWASGMLHSSNELVMQAEFDVTQNNRTFVSNGRNKDILDVLEEIADNTTAVISNRYNIDLNKAFGEEVVSGHGGSPDLEQRSMMPRMGILNMSTDADMSVLLGRLNHLGAIREATWCEKNVWMGKIYSIEMTIATPQKNVVVRWAPGDNLLLAIDRIQPYNTWRQLLDYVTVGKSAVMYFDDDGPWDKHGLQRLQREIESDPTCEKQLLLRLKEKFTKRN